MVFGTSFLITVNTADCEEFSRFLQKLARKYRIIELEFKIETKIETTTKRRDPSA